MAETAAQKTITKAWDLADNAAAEARIAAQALDKLTVLVINGDMDNVQDTKSQGLDTDAYATFAEGIKTIICRAAEQSDQAAKLIHKLRETA